MNYKQLFDREYLGTFEPRRGPPRRPKLAAVLAALNGWPVDARAFQYEIDHKKRLHLYGYAVYADDAPTIFFLDDLSPAEAWELLAARDLIPLSWTDHPRRFERSYHCPHGKLRGCSWCGPGIRTIPSTLAEIVAIASDVHGIETAEAIVGQQFPQHTVLWSVRAKKEMDDRHAEARRGNRQPETPEDKGLADLGYLRWSLLDPYCMVLCPML